MPAAGAGLRCEATDHGLNVQQLGWGFCYPEGWRFRERDTSTTSPQGVDTTLDIVGRDGLFAFVIIGSYSRGSATSLSDWLARNAPDDQAGDPITWGNARQAVKVHGQLKRYALTDHRVYMLYEREGSGNLDVETEMSKRLGSWVFDF